MTYRLILSDEPFGCQIRYVCQDGYSADYGDEIKFKTHRYLPVPAYRGHVTAFG